MTLGKLVADWQAELRASDSAQSYLRGRGLTDDTVEQFRLGYSPVDDGITVPYLTARGKVITVKMRRLSGGKPKYLTLAHDFPLPAPRRHLFNARVLLEADRVLVTEGEFDAMVATQAGWAAVSIPGVSAFEDAWLHLFREVDVLIALDGDSAGRDAAARLNGKFTQAGIASRIVDLPDGQDVTDVYLAGRLEDYLK